MQKGDAHVPCRLVPGFAAVIFSLTLSGVSARAQKKQAPQTPPEKPRKIKTEPNKAFKEWIKEVEPIITESERKAFEKLQTDEEREQFIGIFWHKRDPDPDTEENKYKDEYHERVAYANEHFTSGKPGTICGIC